MNETDTIQYAQIREYDFKEYFHVTEVPVPCHLHLSSVFYTLFNIKCVNSPQL